MQIHSAIILKINNEFSVFFTYQINHDAEEFRLLQSAMSLDKKDKKIYSDMVATTSHFIPRLHIVLEPENPDPRQRCLYRQATRKGSG